MHSASDCFGRPNSNDFTGLPWPVDQMFPTPGLEIAITEGSRLTHVLRSQICFTSQLPGARFASCIMKAISLLPISQSDVKMSEKMCISILKALKTNSAGMQKMLNMQPDPDTPIEGRRSEGGLESSKTTTERCPP